MNEIIKIRIQNELDIVLAYKRARQLSEFTGMNISSQTKFGTAVSEICRNVLEHVGEGNIAFNIVDEDKLYLEALITDRGRGIENVEEILERKFINMHAKGCGIINSKKLVEQFSIESRQDKGTRVRMRKKIPSHHPPINNAIILGWQNFFKNEESISPYEEIKKQNIQLIVILETLRVKNLETEYQLDEIKRLNNDLDKFAYTVSHDLKAPLRNMEGIASMIEDSLEKSDIIDAKASCDILKSQLQRLDWLINGILFYAKEGKRNIVKNKVAVYDLVHEVVKTLKISKKYIININEELPVLLTEEVLLSQVFSNLISNAIKYHDRDAGTVNIDFSRKGNIVVFSVADDGPGITSENARKIFQIFESLTNSHSDSTGIGLSIVKNIVTEKGGEVWLESEGRGSKFLFTWPDQEIEKIEGQTPE
jgi:signal transduction histidine kinase